MSRPPKYRIYPSLLDRFNEYRYIDAAIEKPWNADKTPSDVEAEIERGLLDAINRVPSESEAAERGTCFNNLVDAALAGMMTISSNAADKTGTELIRIDHKSRMGTTYTFDFPVNIVQEFVD